MAEWIVYYDDDGNEITKGQLIRCKDCKHKYIEDMVWSCPFGLPGGPEFFCLYGAKGESDG